MKTLAQETIAQLTAAGYWRYILTCTEGPKGIGGLLDLAIIPMLEADSRFARGWLFGMHLDVGPDLCEFRSERRALGRGSMQIVISQTTGRYFADIDKYFPYDVAGGTAHLFGEVMPNFFRGLFGRRKDDASKGETA